MYYEVVGIINMYQYTSDVIMIYLHLSLTLIRLIPGLGTLVTKRITMNAHLFVKNVNKFRRKE